MKTEQLIKFFGSQANAARQMSVSRAAVSQWVAAGVVPKSRQYQAEILTGGALKANPAKKKAEAA